MRHKLMTALAAASALVALAPANATTLLVDTGWQNDQLNVAGDPTQFSPWTFTILTNAIFSITDSFIPGDIYTLSGDLVGTTSFFAGGAGDIQATGAFGGEWQNASYSKLALAVGPGSYNFSITGDGKAGVPAGFGIRLDSVGSVPEPATWAMMLAGFGAVGFTMRRRPKVSVSVG